MSHPMRESEQPVEMSVVFAARRQQIQRRMLALLAHAHRYEACPLSASKQRDPDLAGIWIFFFKTRFKERG